MAAIQDSLVNHLSDHQNTPRLIRRRLSRRLQHFKSKSKIEFRDDAFRNCSIMELTTSDRPGLLALVAKAFQDCNIVLLNAKIATFGEKVADVFFITNQELQALAVGTEQEELIKRVQYYLDS